MSSKQPPLIYDGPIAVAEAAAERLLSRTGDLDVSAICLAGGSTPKLLYGLLASPRWRERIPWKRIHWFMGDERAVPELDPRSNGGEARRAFLDACAPSSNVHLISVTTDAPAATADAYENTLKRFHSEHPERRALFDLVFLGVGPDGHVASLFPDSTALHESRRWVVPVDHANVAPFVPRISLTLPCLGNTQEMVFLVIGAGKREVLARIFSGDDLPAKRARPPAGEAVWLIDRAAAT